uniref:PRORP domain-containing protein n=1 Tax=viral metagenome TaxID=1070528 RepID=A0A6C0H8X1_9ZZZZ
MLAYKLYYLLCTHNYDEIEKIIKELDIENILLNNGIILSLDNGITLPLDNSILSNLLLYYIKITNNIMINHIYTNYNLMKRDYLKLIKYYFDNNFDNYLFLVINKINLNNLTNTDLDYLINNKIFKILYYLENLFLTTKIINNNLNHNKLKLIYINDNNKYLLLLQNNMKKHILINLIKFYEKYSTYDYIIDAGNILYSDKGNLTMESINGLIKILNNTVNNLIIIHPKHIKNNLIQKYILQNYKYYITPISYDDDIFILWFFFKSLSKCNIISNDKFKNYNFILKLNTDYNLLLQQIINYSISNYELNNKHTYSNCIQIIDNHIYIPNIENSFSIFNL